MRAAVANAASIAPHVVRSSGSRQRLRRVQLRGRVFSDRRGICALKGESLGNEVERRPNPHRDMAGKAKQKPAADVCLRPCGDESGDERRLEGDMGRYPKPRGKCHRELIEWMSGRRGHAGSTTRYS